MGEQYIRQVSRKLNLSRSRKKEILHDLEELFAEAASHGEKKKSLRDSVHRKNTQTNVN